MKPGDLATVGVFGNRHEAEVARARLEDAGLEAWVQSDDLAGYEPQLGLTNGVRVVVRTAYMAIANQVLEPLEPAEPILMDHQERDRWISTVSAVVAAVLLVMIALPIVITFLGYIA